MKKFLPLIFVLVTGTLINAQPCEGTSLLGEEFENGIPGTWTILDLNPNDTVYWSLEERGYTGAFQAFHFHGRKCVANTSMYMQPAAANDWLISPAISLGSGPLCLSWMAAAMYNWGETYQVRISTTTPTVSAFMSTPALYTETNQPVSWVQRSVDLSAYAGQTVYIGFFYNSNALWTQYFDDIRITRPVSRDASVKTLTLAPVISPGVKTIAGRLLNGGTTAITSMNLHWNVNNGPVNTTSYNALNIAPSAYYTYSHPTTWNASVNGTYSVKVWASNINGSGDQWPSNDTLSQLVYVHTNSRVVFVEEFTNTDCPPCATQNPAFDALLNSNRTAGKVSMVKYHAPWPGPLDPMNNFNPADVGDRLYYYGSLGLPNALMNGLYIPNNNNCMIYGMPECLEQYEIDSAWAIPSIFQIGLANSIVGNNILINVSVTALTSIPENVLRLRTIVVEDAILYTTAPGTNGETDFYQVMRKMLPDADGELLGPMTANQTLNFSYSWPYSTPVDPMELRTLAVIQNENNFSIYQSKMTSTIAQGMNEEMSAIQLELFPNPIADKLTISAVFAQAGTAQVSILNAISQEIIQLSKESVNGSYTRTLDLSELAAGIYYFRMEVDGKVMMKKVVKY